MIKVKYHSQLKDEMTPVSIEIPLGVAWFTKKAACELNRKLSEAIHKMVEDE